jgi:hypothetical protein
LLTVTTALCFVLGPAQVLVAAEEPDPAILDYVVFGAGDHANGNSTTIGNKVNVSGGLVGGNRKVHIRAGSNTVGIRAGADATVGNDAGGEDEDDGDLGLTAGIIANGKVRITAKGTVLGNIDGNEIHVGSKSTVQGNVTVAGEIHTIANATIDGSASGASATIGNNARILGTLLLPVGVAPTGPGFNNGSGTIGTLVNGVPPAPQAFAKIALPAALEYSASSSKQDDRTAANSGTLTLAPGTYRDVDIKQKATLNLSAGTYVLRRLKTAAKATLNIDASNGDVLILATDNVDFGQDLAMNITGGSARDVYLETAGTFSTAANSVWKGTVFSTKSNSPGQNGIAIGQKNAITGALYSNQQVHVAQRSTVVMEIADFFAAKFADEPPATITLLASKDSYLRSGGDNTNEGANTALRLAASGNNRAVIDFDLPNINLSELVSATLVLTIEDNTDNWGSDTHFRYMEPRRITVDWLEGNGINSDVPNAEKYRGDGPGVTWNCAIDLDIHNQNPDGCAQWNGGTFAALTAAPVRIVNGLTGEITFDVTQDVLAGADFGWVIKKSNEGQSGRIHFHSKEGAALAGNANLAARLILDFAVQPPPPPPPPPPRVSPRLHDTTEGSAGGVIFMAAGTSVGTAAAIADSSGGADGDPSLGTADGLGALLDEAFFTEEAASLGLAVNHDGHGNLVLSPRDTDAVYYIARPAASAVPAFRGTQEGLHFYPVSGLEDEQGLSLIFRDTNGSLLEQDLVPVPADWLALQATLAGTPGLAGVSIDSQGVISAQSRGTTIRGRVTFRVNRSDITTDDADAGVLLLPGTDLNDDGTDDYQLLYPNGDVQGLLIYPQP